MSEHMSKAARRARAAGIRQHEADALYFAARPQMVWRVRRHVARELVTDAGVDQHPDATHLFVLTDWQRERFTALPLTLPAGISDADARAVAVRALRALVDTDGWERMG